MNNFNITIIHGIGDQESGYSRKFQKAIKKQLSKWTKKKFRLQFNEIVYSDIIDKKIKAYTEKESALDLNYKKFRELFNFYANDAMAFEMRSIKSKINDKIENLDKDVDGYHKIYIAHSLGGIVLFNYLIERDKRIDTIFTLGSPVALFLENTSHLDKIKELTKHPFWLNIVGSDDVIAKPIFMDECDYNYIAKVGSFGVRQTPISHTSYFDNDDNVIKPIAKRILGVIDDNFKKKDFIKYVDGLWNI